MRLEPDYDSDPGRWRSMDRRWQLAGDVHEVVAERIARRRLGSVLDLGCGQGRLREVLPARVLWAGVDRSPTQLRDCPHRPVVRADAGRLPFADGAFDAVAALWMLYHLERPQDAIREARRVLRPGGVFFTCTSARTNDPELCDSYPATTFDAEEAPEVVADAFGDCALEVEPWDAPLVRLPDRDAVAAYARSHHLPEQTADRVAAPVTLAKRGVLVSATVPGPAG
jgi:SAM-dependent methyltransferase